MNNNLEKILSLNEKSTVEFITATDKIPSSLISSLISSNVKPQVDK